MCALAGALQVNQSLQELKWVQLLMCYTCSCTQKEVYTEIVVYTSDHMHYWRMMTDLRRGPHLWPRTARAYIKLHCVPWSLIISRILNAVVKIFLTIYFFCSLIFCSLSNNKISADGVCALVGALLVNQSLQKLKLEWVQPFVSYLLRGVCTLSCIVSFTGHTD